MTDRVHVYVRVRQQQRRQCVEVRDTEQRIDVVPDDITEPQRSYRFDEAFPTATTQGELFDAVGIQTMQVVPRR